MMIPERKLLNGNRSYQAQIERLTPKYVLDQVNNSTLACYKLDWESEHIVVTGALLPNAAVSYSDVTKTWWISRHGGTVPRLIMV